MVSLRERKSRPSYAVMHQGLDDVSDDDQTARAAPSKVGPSSRPTSISRAEDDGSVGTAAVNGQGDAEDVEMSEPVRSLRSPSGSVVAISDSDDDGSVSSGGSSEFAPSERSVPQKRARPRPGVKTAQAITTLAGENSEEATSEAEERDDGTGPGSPAAKDSGTGDEPVEPDFPAKKVAPPRPTRLQPWHRSTPSIMPGTPGSLLPTPRTPAPARENNINDIPAEYRALLKASTQEMAKITVPVLPPQARLAQAAEKSRTLGLEACPYGPRTPFVTRLAEPPAPVPGGQRTSAVKAFEHGGTDEERRQKSVRLGQLINWETPWQAWEGEGWWPELYDPSRNSSDGPVAGPSRPPAWKLREEVRLGFDHIGRGPVDSLDVIKAAEAATYMPTPADADGNPAITVHVGPPAEQTALSMKMLDHFATRDHGGHQDAFVFFAGGPIWGLDWCPVPQASSARFDNAQYLAVSCLPHLDTQPAMGEKWPAASPAAIQIWSVVAPLVGATGDNREDPGSVRCEMVLCIPGGSCLQLKWMPMGAWDEIGNDAEGNRNTVPKLGVVAAVQLDGSVSLYAVPHPRVVRQTMDGRAPAGTPIYLRVAKPLVALKVPDASVLCIDFMSGTKIAAGLSNGHAVVWDVGPVLRGRCSPDLILPSSYMSLTVSPIRTIACARSPPGDEHGRPMYGSEPTHLIYGSYDGTIGMVDVRDPSHPVDFGRQRAPVTAVGWSTQLACPLHVDVEYQLVMRKTFGAAVGRTNAVSSHCGPIWDISASDYHNTVVTAGSDGAVILASTQAGFLRARKQPMCFHRLYEIDYDSHTGHYRMSDQFVPEKIAPEVAGGRRQPKQQVSAEVDPNAIKTPAWSPQVGIHRVAWHNAAGLSKAGWVASGGAAGLIRVDWVSGRWPGGDIPAEYAHAR